MAVDFREPGAARAGGYALTLAGVLVAGGLALHPLPSRGLFEQASVLASTPLWGPIHVAIAMGFTLCVLGGLLMLAAGDAVVYDAFNRLLVGFGWLGNPLFLAGLTTLAFMEVRTHTISMSRELAWFGLAVALLSWLRGIGSATGLYFLEPFVLANIPAFLWLGWYGWRVASLSANRR